MRRLSTLYLVLAAGLTMPGRSQDVHLNEAGSGVVLSRSAFAHGYRHGYEEGYHLGNMDINMGRVPRPLQKARFRGLKLKTGYVPAFGSKRLFEDGFAAGLRAGYSDGYAGEIFRAVDSLRQMAVEMASNSPPQDPSGNYFDQGLAAGYQDGWQQAATMTPNAGPADSQRVDCGPSRAKNPGSPAQATYCEGYRRGYVLAKNDMVALRRSSVFLEASK